MTLIVPVALIVEPEGKKSVHHAQMLDVSERGVRLMSDISFKPGQILQLSPSGVTKYGIPGRVVWVGKAGLTLRGHVGVELLRPFPTTVWQQEKSAGQ